MTVYRVMVVDNQREVRMLLRRSLAALKQEFQVTEAVSGEEALLMLRLDPVDLLVTDMRLAGITGLELYVKSRQLHPGIKGILLSASSDAYTRQQSAALEIQYVLDKPVDPAAYLLAVEKLFGLQAGVQPVPVVEPLLVEEFIVEDAPEPGLADQLAALRQGTSAVTAALLSEVGQLVAQSGDPLEDLLSPEQIQRALAASSAGMSLSVALGSGMPQGILYFPSLHHNLYLAPVGAALVLVVVCPVGPTGEQSSQIIRRLLPAIDDLLHILARMGVPVMADVPRVAEIPEAGDSISESVAPDPALDALFARKPLSDAFSEKVDEYWEIVADRTHPYQSAETDSLTYDQARQLGLAPEDGSTW